MTSAGSADESSNRGRRRRGVTLVGVVVAATLVASLTWLWQRSLIPDTYSVLSMGYADYGGGSVPDHTMAGTDGHGDIAHRDTKGTSVAALVGPHGPADVSVTLTARAETIHLGGASERSLAGFTINHESPGPQITVREGQLLEVRLVNESVPDGVTLHWHGVDVPNAEDGVAGVTQDAVGEGDDYLYRFVAEDAGTYWYHSHQVSDEQVSKGLFGALIVLPAARSAAPAVAGDIVAVVHTYSGSRTVNGIAGTERAPAEPGSRVRVRVVNTNDGLLRTWVNGSSYQVLAIDGTDLHEPELVEDRALVVPAGGRADLLISVPTDGTAASVNMGGGTLLAVGPPDGEVVTGEDPGQDLDLLTYGSPAPLGLDPASADRQFEYRIGRRLAFLDGKPGFWWTINGHLYPDVPMFVVEEGDVVLMTIANDSGQGHPMHLHGHHAVVLSRNGEPASGSPWWVDSLDVADGESYVVAFTADNPGIWMDHCHNLPHASEGLVTHLMYAGVTTPFVVGGDHDNDPE